MAEVIESWGRWPQQPQQTRRIKHRFDSLPAEASMLPFGNGRSYGDVCLNGGGVLLMTRGLDRFIAFDPTTGVLECEAGMLLNDIIELALPHGWFLPVSPGTCFVTVGGAIANDVHGKNHHRVGSFGNHVLRLELQRSDGRLIDCSAQDQPHWFAATVGGLGLTGLIRRATLQMRRVPTAWIGGDSQRFANLGEFTAIANESDAEYEYTVAWIDCAGMRSKLGRGVFMRGNHSSEPRAPVYQRVQRLPFTPPFSLVNRLSVSTLNRIYFHRPAAQQSQAFWDFRQFFYPLDRISNWNRIYGPKGFFQYQCVVPGGSATEPLEEMLKIIGRSGLGSFLAVLKMFGDIRSLGMLSFPRPGATLALDFPNRGQRTLSLLESLDSITRSVGGAVYPAKDARMSAASFQQYFPLWEQFKSYVDPKFSSSFWRRVTGSAA